tara:strand:- start:3392 stop:5497 length:2106 start_codon:yes stop_codon:yes gene_type:complete
MRCIKCLTLIISITFSLNVNSQIDLSNSDRLHCGSAVVNNQRLSESPNLKKISDAHNQIAIENEQNMEFTSGKKAAIYTIPVVYHVIHDNGVGNVSKTAIEASIKNLNDDFQKLNSDLSDVVSAFIGIAADCQIQFRLAHLDPNGNCTEGITRTSSPLTNTAGENVKSLVNWNTTKYLNIWVVQTLSSGAGGYSYYPGFAPSQNAEGIIIRSAQLGNSVTHEVGHYLNLPHCWGNSNNPGLAGNCNDDDGVADTPPTIGQVSCNTAYSSCSSLDNVQNYMEYSFCERMFTEGQKSRMHTALNQSWGSRNTLWTGSNLLATGTDDPYNPAVCVPIAGFKYGLSGGLYGLNPVFICEGESVSFNDDSYDATPTIFDWVFTGGTPNISNVQNPTIVYNSAGVYDVTHQPGTAAGIGNETKNGIITVTSVTADYSGIIVDGFENSTNFNNEWRIENLDGGGQPFTRITTSAATGAASVRIMNRFISVVGERHELVTPSYDLSSLANPIFNFKVAFARRSSSNNDRLLVWYSLDCGSSWSLAMAPMQGSALSTIGSTFNNGVWIPGTNDWDIKSGSLNSITNETNVRFKFAFDSGGGNNLYIDDINIDGTLSTEDKFKNVVGFSVYPNPTSSSAKISFNLVQGIDNLTIKVRNAVGQIVTDVISGESFNAGKYTLNVDQEKKLSSGLYFIEFNADDKIQVQKLIVR